ncbi:hypothetical protein AJ78_02960 [Emergomyces pasteurianus Ep9510]|uniref:Glutamyl-tRNA synthetase n=1 Tax=Emergomyces pasteurianus Ep9510 TaxID=1447872 RepID=A0A1J9Q9K3_9EURO|nr:hypothetical protein AJ78_02960 [Emergomyces pasteurianus Ep9510]
MASKFDEALVRIDDAHREDPNIVSLDGSQVPYELHYANKMTKYLELRDSSASEILRLAVRAQHLRRWEIPRSSYPMTRPGYFAWRAALKNRQADIAEQICRDCGYDADEAGRVASLVRKENMKQDEECQTLEDVACLVFLDDQFEKFEKEHDEEKIVGILKKTWAKMSQRGHELALQIKMSERAKGLVAKVLS